ncbi:DUF308 domain-containing protein [Pigmentiphaga litoralis]|uniref:Uncharacterized membrane protein HdeD (DUF308 family) n=1 Tax=Pigmentiphaga litoralis TaxID=516702 RepID=A0A7Y9IU81_9BURK|nr:DUF308 domain-containing protein [Pigmentiphaga litoralis]NYE24002.1 uncharacterized membrane protein HdeD (DUF308 family) [Pigmentiphaga litoralis]NYE82384.1 uncharacterized membrane protein HdeD (DUF308 family) [Pigmentiphaga litoralis]
MTTAFNSPAVSTPANTWLKTYYFLRAAFSFVWVLAALTAGRTTPLVGMMLLVAYPAWDAVANFIDARQSGGARRNPTQMFNVFASGMVTVSIAVALTVSMHAVLGVFGVWAALAGLLQLATGVRRWKTHGAQWPMILSGAQSTLAGVLFIQRAAGPGLPGIADIAPYAAFGAFYFLVSGMALLVKDFRRP